MSNDVNTTDKVIITTYTTSDGVELTSFTPNPNYQEPGLWNWLKRMFSHCEVRPTINCRDLNNTKSAPYENKPINAIEVGVEVKF